MRSSRHKKFLDILTAVAESNPPVGNKNSKMSAAVVLKNRIVAVGINSMKTDPFQLRFGKNEHSIFLHAEISAIKNAISKLGNADLSSCTLYICRVRSHTDKIKKGWGIAKPCDGCNMAIAEFGIKRLVYTLNCENNINYEVLPC